MTIIEVKDKYITKKAEQAETEFTINGLQDGGNTLQLKNIISSPTNSSYQVRNELYPYSPYLSNEVLIDLINRNAPSMEQWHLTDLLIANSPLDLDVWNLYYETEPVDDFFHNLLMLYQSGENALTQLKKIKDQAINDKQLAKSSYYRMILLDLEAAYAEGENMSEIIEEQTTASDYHMKFSLALQSDDYTEAQNLLDNYPIAEEYDGFKTINEIMLNRAQNNLNQPLEPVDIADLTVLAESNLPGKYRAQSLLEILNEIESQEIVVLPQSNKSLNFSSTNRTGTNDLEFFSIYPNPASDHAYFTFLIPEEIETALILIHDQSGRLVDQINISSIRNIYQLNLEKYSSGMYTASFSLNNKLISKEVFNVVK